MTNSASPSQFSLSTILWATTAVALLLAHARNLGPQSIKLFWACCIFWITSATLFGLVLGVLRGRLSFRGSEAGSSKQLAKPAGWLNKIFQWTTFPLQKAESTPQHSKEVFFWSALICVEAFLAVSAVRAFGFSQACGWCMVGAVCGGLVGARPVTHRLWGSLASAALGGLSMLAVLVYFREPLGMEQWLDLAGAVSVGFVLWHFVDFMRWFLESSRQSPIVMAAWLTLSVLAGNWAVTYFGY